MQAGIARALYNLGNIYHAHGKQISRVGANHEPGKCSPEVVELLQKAVDYYELVATSYFVCLCLLKCRGSKAFSGVCDSVCVCLSVCLCTR